MSTKSLYRRKESKRPFAGLAVGTGLVIIAGAIVWKLPPNKPVTEGAMLFSFILGLFILISWITRTKKWAIIICLGIAGGLAANRLGSLNIMNVGLGLVLLGLISLVN